MPSLRSGSFVPVTLAALVAIATLVATGPTVVTAQTSSCVKRQILTIDARILDVWKGKNATAFTVDVRPYSGCRIVSVVVTTPPSSCVKGAQVKATGEIDEPEGPLDGFEMWKTTTVACRR